MNDIFKWLDRVLSPTYEPTEKDYEILYYLRLTQRLIKEEKKNMKIRGKSRKIDIQKVFIEKDPYGGTNVSIIVNNQLLEIYSKTVYIDEVLMKINEYTKILGADIK